MTERVFSASQVSVFELCARKWAFRYVDRVEEPPSRWAAFGLGVHQLVAHRLSGQSTELPGSVSEADCARALAPYLPSPHPDLLVEQRFLIDLDGVSFVGYIDLLDSRPDVPVVYDHKTTSGLEWARSADELPSDVQAALYAEAAMQTLDVPAVRLQWTYVTTRGAPKVAPVSRSVAKEDIKERNERTVESARRMLEVLATGAKGLDVPPSPAACEAFGGCPYRDRCGDLTAEDALRSVMSQQTAHERFLERMKSRGGSNGGDVTSYPDPINVPVEAAPEPKPEAAPEPKPEPVPPPIETKAQRKRRVTAAGPTVAIQTTAEPEPEPEPKTEGFTLYLDCYPTKGGEPVESGQDRIDRVLKTVLAETGKAHYKLIPYGEGTGLFASLVARDLVDRPPTTAVYLSTKSVAALDCLHAFYAAAGKVVQG
jgi:hypothetical protein